MLTLDQLGDVAGTGDGAATSEGLELGVLAEDAIKAAITDWRKRKGEPAAAETRKAEAK